MVDEFVLVHNLLGKTRHIPVASWTFQGKTGYDWKAADDSRTDFEVMTSDSSSFIRSIARTRGYDSRLTRQRVRIQRGGM